MEFLIILAIVFFIYFYRQSNGESVYQFVTDGVGNVYEKYAPYSFKMIREKCKEMGLEYTPKQYVMQVVIFSGLAFVISYLYFYNVVTSVIYVVIVDAFIPYLA